jgi:methanesulfonate monooxygenase large subunit
MPARNHTKWKQVPGQLKAGEYVSSKIYSDEKIFKQEMKKIFSKVWVPVCHESELPENFRFRTTTIAGVPIMVVRDRRGIIRALGNTSERRPSGNVMEEGFKDNPDYLHCDIKFGGFVWVTLNDNPPTMEEWVDGSFDCMKESLNAEPLDVFHYHKAIIPCNYKLWHDTNSEFYHDYLHFHNRVTGFNDSYFARENKCFNNGHVNVGSFEVQYDQYDGFESREELSFPHLPTNHWEMIDMFPGINFNLRGSALRVDVMTPLSPDKVMIEFRGLGLKSDTPEERLIRQRHHNSIWGPFGRNLHEDLLAVTTQQGSMHSHAEERRILHGRHENNTIHDEVGMRHYYDEWGKWMDMNPSNPEESYPHEEVQKMVA